MSEWPPTNGSGPTRDRSERADTPHPFAQQSNDQRNNQIAGFSAQAERFANRRSRQTRPMLRRTQDTRLPGQKPESQRKPVMGYQTMLQTSAVVARLPSDSKDRLKAFANECLSPESGVAYAESPPGEPFIYNKHLAFTDLTDQFRSAAEDITKLAEIEFNNGGRCTYENTTATLRAAINDMAKSKVFHTSRPGPVLNEKQIRQVKDILEAKARKAIMSNVIVASDVGRGLQLIEYA